MKSQRKEVRKTVVTKYEAYRQLEREEISKWDNSKELQEVYDTWEDKVLKIKKES